MSGLINKLFSKREKTSTKEVAVDGKLNVEALSAAPQKDIVDSNVDELGQKQDELISMLLKKGEKSTGLTAKRSHLEASIESTSEIEKEQPPIHEDYETRRAEVERNAREIEEIIQKCNEEGLHDLPSIKLLIPPKKGKKRKADTDKIAPNIVSAFRANGVSASFLEKANGPRYAHYEFKIEIGVKLVTIKRCAKDISFAVGAKEVEVYPVVGKPSTIAVDVPVGDGFVAPIIREAIEDSQFCNSHAAELLPIGKSVRGDNTYLALKDIKGLLVCGTTGTGKSNFLHAIILSLLYKASPADIRFVMIDAEMRSLISYNGIPHLLIPVVTGRNRAMSALEWVKYEISRRYKLLSKIGTSDFISYNRAADNNEKIPRIVVVADEINSIPDNKNEVAGILDEIVKLGSTTGVCLIATCTKPSRRIVESFPSKATFATTTEALSRQIIGREGAEKLSGEGEMLFVSGYGSEPVCYQTFNVSSEEVENVVSFLRMDDICYSEDAVNFVSRNEFGSNKAHESLFEMSEEHDEMFTEAVETVLEIGEASVSALQRRLKLGYSRAARIIDEMETSGIVGPFDGAKPRQINISRAQWEKMKNEI